MRISRIQEYINKLSEQPNLHEDEVALLKQFKNEFSKHPVQDEVSTEHYERLKFYFSKRWYLFKKLKSDAIFRNTDANLLWIALAKDIGDELHQNYLSIIIPSWTSSSNYSTHLLNALKELLESYHCETRQSSTSFIEALQRLVNELSHSSAEEINAFCGITVELHLEPVCILEILLACWQRDSNLQYKLIALVRWLAKTNPNIIVLNSEFSSVYQEMRIGPYFDVTHLQNLIAELRGQNLTKPVSNKLKTLHALLKDMLVIETQAIELIKDIYNDRWYSVMDTKDDYLRNQNGINAPWIRLAQYLAGANLIDENYYCLLISSLSHDRDNITFELLTHYPLPSYILSENNNQLILLGNCVKNHMARGTFYNCNTAQPKPLTKKEKIRIQYASPQFYEYYKKTLSLKATLPISKNTVMQIIELVNQSLYPSGLQKGNQYSTHEMTKTNQAYEKFLNYVSNLSAEESNRLYAQRILLGNDELSFLDLMNRVQNDPENDLDGCVAKCSKFLIKLILDYDPEAQFTKSIHQKIDIKHMSQCSAMKVYSDYDSIDQHEAIRRSLCILVSLMTHQFHFLYKTGTPIKMWDCSNITTETGKKIFDALQSPIVQGNLLDIRFIYTNLIENIIKPALLEGNTIKTYCTRFGDTSTWLTKIQNELLFSKENTRCFEPITILSVLWKLIVTPKNAINKEHFAKFIEEIIRTMAQSYNQYLVWIRVNVKLEKFLENFNIKIQNSILTDLRNAESVSSTQRSKTISDLIINQIAMIIAQRNIISCTFFSDHGVINEQVYNQIQHKLTTKLEAESHNTDIDSVRGLINTIKRWFEESTENDIWFDKHLVKKYCEDILNPIEQYYIENNNQLLLTVS